MKTQMEYLHKQMPIDGVWKNETITGVPVALTAIGSDGSVIDIGTVTTNGYYGTFEQGSGHRQQKASYEIIASFAGDESYGSSAASTAVAVGPAPAADYNSRAGNTSRLHDDDCWRRSRYSGRRRHQRSPQLQC